MREEPETIAPEGKILAEQFDDLEQQREAGHVGMWIFLATEVLLFGGLFAAYTAYRTTYPEAWSEGGHHLYFSIGSTNTLVLLSSSLFMALAVHAAKQGQSRKIVMYLLITMALGAVFLGLKGLEYYLDISDHLLPWAASFHVEGPHPEQQRLFLVFYWIMTALHALHMTIGISVLAVIALLARRGFFSVKYHNPVEIAGLYWHFVDIVWIFLLPTFYLVHAK